ncbi:hypothetical protein RclHR1_03680007 [Rhizophagus clarus]|uniref:F-box domain-containing protein n=1 Tax=Rhizophagus clarus TaxID=94130 RepID=A0A2Z6RFW2_9GLOM|nr:hypothetical protein RclHR1_03680007 [Rhizophagus clarus]GES76420.1 hypothetical protein GLOIN_2v1784405 [Rhizophagus clarus]
MPQLPADCLNEIFEYLSDDKFTLHSCILVNRLWCEISVRILWKNVWKYSASSFSFSTLVACLPNESKKLLRENGINISTPTFEFPTFDYASFCKVLPIGEVYYKLGFFLENQQLILSKNFKIGVDAIAQEIIKLFLRQITSLKQLKISKFWQFLSWQTPNTNFVFYPEAKDCLKNLSELHCTSDISSEFFYQLSQLSHNITILNIMIENHIPNGLTDLISAQRCLKCSKIAIYDVLKDITDLLLKKLPDTLTKLNLYGGGDNISLSFITSLINLEELQLEFGYSEWFKNFEILQHTIFPQLQVLKIVNACPKCESLIKFLENNGKNLREIYLCEYSGYCDNSLNLAIANFCPILKKISTGIKNYELETLEIIFDGCQYLESIKIWCGGLFLNDMRALQIVMKYSKNINEIVLDYRNNVRFKILPKELETIFMNNTSRKPFSLVVNNDFDIINSLDKNGENIKIIEKYIKLGMIKRFKVY